MRLWCKRNCRGGTWKSDVYSGWKIGAVWWGRKNHKKPWGGKKCFHPCRWTVYLYGQWNRGRENRWTGRRKKLCSRNPYLEVFRWRKNNIFTGKTHKIHDYAGSHDNCDPGGVGFADSFRKGRENRYKCKQSRIFHSVLPVQGSDIYRKCRG